MNKARKLRKSTMNNKQIKGIEIKYQPHLGGDHLMIDGEHNLLTNAKFQRDHQSNFNNQMINNQQQFRSKQASTSNRPMIATCEIEREFITNQLKRYGSDYLDQINYLPPVAQKDESSAIEIMTTMSQPVNFLKNNNSKANCLPSRRALLKSSTNRPKEFNFDLINQNDHQNFNTSTQYKMKESNQIRSKNKSTTLSNRSFLPIQNRQPLLVCGPTATTTTILNEKLDDCFDNQNGHHQLINQKNNFNTHFNKDLNQFSNQTRFNVKENLYERIPCKKDDKFKKPIIEQESDDDNCYDNLDDCLVNFNGHFNKDLNNLQNRAFIQSKGFLSNQSNSPMLSNHSKNLTQNEQQEIELRNSSTNSPNFTIKSNNSNRSIRSNLSNQSKRSNLSNLSKNNKFNNLSSNLSSNFNNENPTNDRLDFNRLIFSRSSTSSNDVFIHENQSDSFNSNSNESGRRKKRTDQMNSILNARNENGQMKTRLDHLENISSSE